MSMTVLTRLCQHYSTGRRVRRLSNLMILKKGRDLMIELDLEEVVIDTVV